MICRSRKNPTSSRGDMLTSTVVIFVSLFVLTVEGETNPNVFEEVIRPVCKPGLFDCQDSTGCISASWICDGEVDCTESGLDERQECCAEGKQFECHSDGLCIDLKYKCDSFADCTDSSDERNCSDCSQRDLFHCDSHRCIDPVFVCDQDNDCGDFSDEVGCDPENPDTFLCQNKERAVHRHQLCDGVNDCGDMSDEVGCDPCEPFHFPCQDSQGCVLVFDLCDGQAQCHDASDELWCNGCGRLDQFKCDNGNCVLRSEVCNHVNDCGDSSDEKVCSCQPGIQFRCTSGVRDHYNASNVKCIPDIWVCDGMSDCKEGEDEKEAMCEEMSFNMEEESSAHLITHDCAPDEFVCSDGTCIHNTQVCDGAEQCFRGEDEVGCPAKCPRGTYELCLESPECISYDQFCDGIQDCADNSDESFTNGYCFCSGILCGSKCVPIDRICDSTWDCKHGEDEVECTKCRTNLQSTTTLIDQTIFVISLIKTTYAQMDSFQIYFAALVDKWTSFFGTDDSPFHMNVEAHDPDAQELVDEAQEFLISIVSLRPMLRQFMSVMNELKLSDQALPTYSHSETLNEQVPRSKRYIIERSLGSRTDVYSELIKRCEYLRQKSIDSIQTLSAITKMLHYDFSTCRDHGYYDPSMNTKRSMREVFTALSLVQNNVPREHVQDFVNKLYDLDDQLKQLIVSVQKFDYIIASVAFLIDDAREKLESMVMEDEESNIVRAKRDFLKSSLDTKTRYEAKYDGSYMPYKG